MVELNTRRIVLLGKTGSGKSSLANTIFGEELFMINHTFNSEATVCEAKTKSINGRSITLIDNPGFFDPGRNEKEMKPEIVRCITECAPGPHAFLIVLKVEKFTEHEAAIISRMCEHFSEDALTYAVVVFTHGDQLPEGLTIEEYVKLSEGLSDLVNKCGGRCHIVDNKYWKKNQEDEYRTNQFQVAKLLNTIDEIMMGNNDGYFTNEMLKAVEEEIQREEAHIRQSGNMPQEEVRKQARSNVLKKRVGKSSWTWVTGVVGGAVIAGLLTILFAVLTKSKIFKVTPETPLQMVQEDLRTISVSKGKLPEIIVSQPVNVIEEILNKPPVNTIKKTFQAIMKKLIALYERTHNPWNRFG